MVLGLENVKGLGGLGDINFNQIASGAGQLFLILGIFAFTIAIVALAYWYLKKGKTYDKKIFWFEEVSGLSQPMGSSKAREIILPGTNVPIFYIKEKNMYMPRLTIQTGKNRFWVYVTQNREMVNFCMGSLNKQLGEANLKFDHTDMRYGLTNLLAIIKRNYEDKAQPWWKLYKDTLSMVVLIFILGVAFWFIAGKQAETASIINSGLKMIIQNCPAASGVATP